MVTLIDTEARCGAVVLDGNLDVQSVGLRDWVCESREAESS